MTLTADPQFGPAPAIGTPHILCGSRLLIRTAQRMIAVSLFITSLFVWVAPGAGWENETVLFKILVSITAVLVGTALFQSSLPPLPPTVEIDPAAGELRLVRECGLRGREVIERCRFADLGRVDVMGPRLTFWAQGERLLVELTLGDARVRDNLMAALRRAGKTA